MRPLLGQYDHAPSIRPMRPIRPCVLYSANSVRVDTALTLATATGPAHYRVYGLPTTRRVRPTQYKAGTAYPLRGWYGLPTMGLVRPTHYTGGTEHQLHGWYGLPTRGLVRPTNCRGGTAYPLQGWYDLPTDYALLISAALSCIAIDISINCRQVIEHSVTLQSEYGPSMSKFY